MSIPPFLVDDLVRERREYFLSQARQSRLEHEALSVHAQEMVLSRRVVVQLAYWMILLGQALKQAGPLPVEIQTRSDPCESC